MFDSEDGDMKAAIAQARRTLPAFFRALRAQSGLWAFFRAFRGVRPVRTAFCLKVRFRAGEQTEHIWLADIDASRSPMQGTVGNVPRLPHLAFMQRVTFALSDVTDWMYVEDGFLVGGYTTRLIRSRLSPEELAGQDASLPYRVRP